MTGIKLSLFMSVVIAVITALLCSDILKMMKTPDEIFSEAFIYLLITFVGIPCTFFYNLFSYIIRALGDSRTPFKFLLFAAVANVLLDLLFIAVLGMGVEGAAIATLIAQGVSAYLCYRYMFSKFAILATTADERRFSMRLVKRLLYLGVPIGLQFSITAIGSIILQSANNMLGASCVAAYAAASRIKMFFFSPLESLGIAMATFCGQNYGAEKPERILSGVKSSMLLVVAYSVFAFAVIWLFSDYLSMMFISSSETDIIADTTKFLVITTAFFPLLGSLCVFRYAIQGVGYTVLAMTAGVFEMVARTVMGLYAVGIWGYTAVCFGDPMAWVAANIFLFPAFIYVYRKIRR